jgi:hypothetical protein
MVEVYPEKKFLPETAKVDKQRKFKELFLQQYIRPAFLKYMDKIQILILRL